MLVVAEEQPVEMELGGEGRGQGLSMLMEGGCFVVHLDVWTRKPPDHCGGAISHLLQATQCLV